MDATKSYAERARRGITRLAPRDVEELRRFQAQHFGPDSRQADPRSFAWRFEQHPHVLPTDPPVWICRRDGKIVGQQAGLPFTLHAADRRIPALWTVDLMVDPAWRLRGVAMPLTDALTANTPLSCSLNLSDAAYRAFRRAGWVDLGHVPRFARLLRPLRRGERPLGSAWSASGATAALSHAASPVLATVDAVAVPGLRAGTMLEKVSAFDERADAVWARAEPHYPALARRDLTTLSWRFDRAPQANAYERHYLLRRGEPLGYAVTRRKGRSLVVVDYLCEPHAITPLFAHCLALARQQGAALLACLAMPPAVRRRLKRLGFLEKPGPRFMMWANDPQGLPMSLLTSPEAWFVTDGDSDLDHAPSTDGEPGS